MKKSVYSDIFYLVILVALLPVFVIYAFIDHYMKKGKEFYESKVR